MWCFWCLTIIYNSHELWNLFQLWNLARRMTAWSTNVWTVSRDWQERQAQNLHAKKEYKCGTTCPVCFKLCLSFINIIKICTNCSTNVPNTWLIANKLGQLTCINGRRFQSCNSNNSPFLLFTWSTTKDALWSQRVCFSSLHSLHSKDVEREFEVMLYGPPPGSATDALWSQRVCFSSLSFCCGVSFWRSASYDYKRWQTTP